MSFMPTYASVLPFVCSYDRFSPFGCPCCKLITFFFPAISSLMVCSFHLLHLLLLSPVPVAAFFYSLRLFPPTLVLDYHHSPRTPPMFSIRLSSPLPWVNLCPWFRCFLPYLSSYAWLFAPFSFPSWCLLSLARTGSFSFLYRRFFCRDDLSAAL